MSVDSFIFSFHVWQQYSSHLEKLCPFSERKIKYNINYEVDLSNADNEAFFQLLRNMYDSLSRKKQDYLINGNSNEELEGSLNEVINNLKEIIDTFKKDTALIKKI